MARERVRSFIQLLNTNLISKTCWALTLLLLVRTLGMHSFGLLTTLWSMAVIAASVADLGTAQAVLREGSRDHTCARMIAAMALRIQLIVSVLLTAALAAGLWLLLPTTGMGDDTRAWVIVLSVLTPIIDRLQALFTVWSQIAGSYKVYSRLRSGYFMILLAALAAVALIHADLLAVSATYFLLTLLFAIQMGRKTWRLLPAGAAAQTFINVRTLTLQGLPFLGVMALTLLYGRVEVAILGAWGMTAAAGAFHLIYQMVLLCYSVCGLLFTVVYPRLYRHLRDQQALLADYRDTVRWLSLMVWIAVPPLLLFATPILHLLGGATLTDFAPLLRVLSVLIVLIPASVALNYLLPMDMLRRRIICDLAGLLVTIIGAVYAAINTQFMLAAWAAVCGYACAIVLAHTALHKHLRGVTRVLLIEFGSVGMRALPAALTAWLIPGDWWMRIGIFLLVSAGLLWVTGHPIRSRVPLWLAHSP